MAFPQIPPIPKPPVTSPPYGGGGGGTTPASGGGAVNIPNSNGGVLAQSQAALFPCFSVYNSRVEYHALAPSQGINDPLASSSYSWRVEQWNPYRQATIKRLLLTFRDLGQVTVTWTITGVNDDQEVISASQVTTFGNTVPTGKLMTIPINMTLTGLNLQVSVFRAANAGPLAIAQLVPVVVCDDNPL
jgi:hypothetical protein